MTNGPKEEVAALSSSDLLREQTGFAYAFAFFFARRRL